MKGQIRFVAWSALSMILCLGIIAALYWPKRAIWPQFPQSAEPAPQVVVQVDRDFAWRTGDHIPVSVFIKQKPGVAVDLNSLAIEGDFEIAGNPQIFVREERDGTRLVRVLVTLQSFNVKEKLQLKANMSYLAGGQRGTKVVSLPGLELYTSRTWDGRTEIKDGPLPALNGFHWLITVLALLVGLGGSIWCLGYIRRLRAAGGETKAGPLSARALARRDFEAVWRRIRIGDQSEDNYKEIERIIRRLYRIEARTLPEIRFELTDNHPHLPQILVIMGQCGKVLYQGLLLSDKDKDDLESAFDEIVPSAKAQQAAGSGNK